MNKLVLLRGLTSTGKSTLIEHVVDLETFIIKHDDLAKNGWESANQNIYKEMGDQSIDKLKEGYSLVIVEGNFNKEDQCKAFFDSLKNCSMVFELHKIRLICSVNTALQRNKNREYQVDKMKIIQAYSNDNFYKLEDERLFNTDAGINEALAFIQNR